MDILRKIHDLRPYLLLGSQNPITLNPQHL